MLMLTKEYENEIAKHTLRKAKQDNPKLGLGEAWQ